LPAGTVTDANRTEFATISASSIVGIAPRDFVATAPIIAPTLKGTFFYDIQEGGSSQSFYAVPGQPNAPTTLASMIAAMTTLGSFRSNLSQCVDSLGTINPFVFRAIRADDVSTSRKSLTVINPRINLSSYYLGNQVPPGQAVVQNGANDDAYLVSFNDGFGNSARQFFHGVPLGSQFLPASATIVNPQFGSRVPQVTANWLAYLNNFCNQLRALGLGFRYATVQWTMYNLPVGVPPNQIASTGNGTPTANPTGTPPLSAANYNLPGFPANTYTFALQTPVAPILGKFRVIVREMQALKVLNGRWSAIGRMVGTTYCVNVRRRVPNYGDYDGNGYLSPEIWSVMFPGAAAPLAGANGPGVGGVELGEKKLGRPYAQQRGRARNRVT
jgi:hypothetical protein